MLTATRNVPLIENYYWFLVTDVICTFFLAFKNNNNEDDL